MYIWGEKEEAAAKNNNSKTFTPGQCVFILSGVELHVFLLSYCKGVWGRNWSPFSDTGQVGRGKLGQGLFQTTFPQELRSAGAELAYELVNEHQFVAPGSLMQVDDGG